MRDLFARGLEKCFDDWFSVYFRAHKTQRQDFSAGGGWRMTGGGWQVAGGGWRVTGDGWRVTGDGWLVTGGKEILQLKNENKRSKVADTFF